MSDPPVNSSKQHQAFLSSPRQHILMITNHGIHQWQVVPGLPDTGGQNVFVNQFTAALAKQGFKITIINRGGMSTRRPASGSEAYITRMNTSAFSTWKMTGPNLFAKKIWLLKSPRWWSR